MGCCDASKGATRSSTRHDLTCRLLPALPSCLPPSDIGDFWAAYYKFECQFGGPEQQARAGRPPAWRRLRAAVLCCAAHPPLRLPVLLGAALL